MKHSLFSFSSCLRRYDRVEAGFRCRILKFFLYRSFVYPLIHVVDVVEGFSLDKSSCFQSGEIVGAFGSIPVARRQVTTARIIPPGVESTRRGAMALRLSVGGKM